MATDADGDVEMTVPQPVFEVVQPPSLSDHLARFVLKKRVADVTDEDLGLAITRRCSALQNSHIPDMDQLFKDKLKMNLRIEDTEARVVDYFVLFDKIVEDHGLGGILGSGRENEPNYDERMKLRCKYLLKNIAPDMLKLEIERLTIAKPVLKKDDIALYEALVERAREQQHYHRLSKEIKQVDKTSINPRTSSSSSKKLVSSFKSKGSQNQQQAGSKGNQKKPEDAKPRAPPRDGCLVCKGAHWVKDCPTASEDDKAAALKRMNDMMNQRLRAKTVRSMVQPGDRAAILNGKLEVPFRADTGADYDVITRRLVQEIAKLDAALVVKRLAVPMEVEVADGRVVHCNEQCEVDVQLLTAAGPVNLRRVQCLVIEGDADEFLLGDRTLKSLGINVDQLLEQLATKVGTDDDADDIPEDDIVGQTTSTEIMERLDVMIDDARRYHRFAPSSATESTVSETMLLLVEGKVWIPTQAKDLITRILVVAHCGLNAHRGADVMLRQLQAQYWIKSMRKLVKDFVADCLLYEELETLRDSLRSMHQEVVDRKEKTRLYYFGPESTSDCVVIS
ncbi:hypothetical protein P3T76_013237 [Phytophthora citrophthora]|uniref:Integrase zinc-binding domain-containing protein n=1 Tax=Phytophthora citrophthora TaxID=4793 RepID=A0AAD9G495_9STRA|nr:hypothetical protein P3T76_013237 [Phytophthora citrophthora]